MNIPNKMQTSLDKASIEQKLVFEQTYKALEGSGLALYPTNQPDVRALHPKTSIDFIGLQFGPQKGTHLEIRIDSCPVDFLSTTMGTDMFNITLRHWDSGQKPLWAIYRIKDQNDIEAVIKVVKRVMIFNPRWGK